MMSNILNNRPAHIAGGRPSLTSRYFFRTADSLLLTFQIQKKTTFVHKSVPRENRREFQIREERRARTQGTGARRQGNLGLSGQEGTE